MNKKLLLLIFIFFYTSGLHAQLELKVTSDKQSYSYGETIEIKMKFTNYTDSLLEYWGDFLYPTNLEFKNVEIAILGSLVDGVISFEPGVSKTWIWKLEPSNLGIPVESGLQTIYGSGFGLKDSVEFNAPRFLGGQIDIHIKLEIPLQEIQQMRDSMNALVITSDTLFNYDRIEEIWQVENLSIDSLVDLYINDYRIEYLNVYRYLTFDTMTVTLIDPPKINATKYSLFQNYPNPFNSLTKIKYSIEKPGLIKLSIYNLLGQKMMTLVNEQKNIGLHEVQFNANNLPSGIYIYRLISGPYKKSHKMILIK